jgi:hypothetical protein
LERNGAVIRVKVPLLGGEFARKFKGEGANNLPNK